MTEIDEIAIMDEKNQYTPEFIRLLKDYYLNLLIYNFPTPDSRLPTANFQLLFFHIVLQVLKLHSQFSIFSNRCPGNDIRSAVDSGSRTYLISCSPK